MIGLARTLRAARKTDIDSGSVVDIAFYSLVSGLVFAHLVSLLLDLPIYMHSPGLLLDTWRGILSPSGGLRGLSFHGGLFGAVLAAYVYCRRHGLKFMEVIDLFSPGLALGYVFARIGCFLNGCCYGVPTDVPWAVRFHLDPVSGLMTPPSHPVQLYSAAASLGIFFLLVMVERKRRYTGQVFFSYLAMYSVYRFLIEFLRKGVTAQVLFDGITEGQVASIVICAAALYLMHVYGRSRNRDVVESPAAEKTGIGGAT
jgi:phosphatidylglycerol:prolipoprotein diacylglycerol transferase